VTSVLPADRTGVVVVRVWLEPGHEQGLRARITATDLATSREMTVSAASIDEIVEIVRAWIDSFVRAGDGDVTWA
jgi:hypothetical protein